MCAKGLLLGVALLMVLVVSHEAAPWPNNDGEPSTSQKAACPTFCTFEHNPVCGYNGNCYRVFSNQCVYDTEKCTKKSNLETVDNSLCELAQKDTHPSYKICPND